MKYLLSTICFLVFILPGYSSTKITTKAKYKLHEPIIVKIQSDSKSVQYLWEYPDKVNHVETTDGCVHIWAPAGDYQITGIAVDFDLKKIERVSYNFSVEGVDPGPDPKPPVPPDPKPDPAPIPVNGLRVLIVYESGDLSKMPLPQQQILFSKTFRDLLNSKCIVGPDNKTKEWRIYDKDTDVSGESSIWQNAMKKTRTQIPWIVISNGTSGFEGPLPGTVDDAIKLVSKYIK